MFDKIKDTTIDATKSTKDFTVKKWKRFIRKRALKRVEKLIAYAQKKPEDYTKEEMRKLIEKEENEVLSAQGLAWPVFKELARKLINRSLTGHAARDAIILCKDTATAEQWNMFYRRILIKDLRCGVSEKTVNKIAKECVDTTAD